MKNSSSNVSHNKVLILSVICISILDGDLAYRNAEIQNKKAKNIQTKISDIFNITGNKEDAVTKKILSAVDSSDPLNTEQANADDPFTITDKDTATSRLAKQVYSDYVNKEAGNSDLTVSDIAQNALSQLSSSDIPGAKYNLNAISFTDDTSNETIRLYGNNFAEIYTRNLTIIANDEKKYSSNLKAIADIYENISKELLKIKVPVQISSSHLAVVNNYQIMADAFRLIDAQSQDPVKSLLGVKAAKEASEDNDQMFINIGKYFKNNVIIFSNNEIGSIWNVN